MPFRLFVGNLPYDASEAELREHFAPFGPLTQVFLPVDRETGRPRGFAFVELESAEQAEEAIRRLNSQPFKGRPLAVNEARARDAARPPGGPPPPRRFDSPRPASFDPAVPGEARPRTDPGRRFGPDARPARGGRGGFSGRGKKEEKPKGPIRERGGGRMFTTEDDDTTGPEPDIDNVATKAPDSESGEDQ